MTHMPVESVTKNILLSSKRLILALRKKVGLSSSDQCPPGRRSDLWEDARHRAPHGKAMKKLIPACQDLASSEGADVRQGEMCGAA